MLDANFIWGGGGERDHAVCWIKAGDGEEGPGREPVGILEKKGIRYQNITYV